MFARLHTLATTPDQADQGLELITSVFLPWARDSTGFRGLVRLVDRENGKTLVLTLWADEETLRASAAAAETLGPRIVEASGATYRDIEEFEVSVLEIRTDSGSGALT